ncbi:MAG: threonine/serine exporter family protein [Arcobacteraceae bacterium]|nr:threonine/serine exporter family protein [Arcobacteraceae bacterium]
MNTQIQTTAKILLQIGKLLLQHGAETEVVEIGIKRAAKNLEYETIEVLVLPYTIMVSITNDAQCITKMQRAERQDVNFTAVDIVEKIIANINVETNLDELLTRLHDEQNLSTMYPYQLRRLMAGLGCASFSLLFGGDAYIFIVTFLASFIGFSLNTMLLKRFFNPFLVVIAVSFTTALIAGLLTFSTVDSNIAISSSILFLVPSVAFINSVNDFIKRHYTNGLTRGIRGVMISFAIAIGMFMALHILGIERFI